jgi:hypothetical protein
MAKIRYQIITQVEFDTETMRQRIIKSFTKILGEGMAVKKKPPMKLTSSSTKKDVYR